MLFFALLLFALTLNSESLKSPIICKGNVIWGPTSPSLEQIYKLAVITTDSKTSSLIEKVRLSPKSDFSIHLYETGLYRVSLEIPNGWSFSPITGFELSINKNSQSCPQAVSFNFQGFTIYGSINYTNSHLKPDNLHVTLLNKDNSILAKTNSANGLFTFEKLLPSNLTLVISSEAYTNDISEKKIKFKKNVQVETEPLNLVADILLTQSHVFSVNFTLISNERVILYLYSSLGSGSEVDKGQCQQVEAEGDNEIPELPSYGKPICSVVLARDYNRFEFDFLPPTEVYVLMPKLLNKQDSCIFEPKFRQFSNQKEGLMEAKDFKFNVESISFPIQINWPNGSPMNNALVSLTSRPNEVSISDENGICLFKDFDFKGDSSIQIKHTEASFSSHDLKKVYQEKTILKPSDLFIRAKILIDNVNINLPSIGLKSLTGGKDYTLTSKSYTEGVMVSVDKYRVFLVELSTEFVINPSVIDLTTFGIEDLNSSLLLKPKTASVTGEMVFTRLSNDASEEISIYLAAQQISDQENIPHQVKARIDKVDSKKSVAKFAFDHIKPGPYYLEHKDDLVIDSIKLKIDIISDERGDYQEITILGPKQEKKFGPLPLWMLESTNDKSLYHAEMPFEDFTFEPETSTKVSKGMYLINVFKKGSSQFKLLAKKFGFSASGEIKDYISEKLIKNVVLRLKPLEVTKQPKSCSSSSLERIKTQVDQVKPFNSGQFKFNGLFSGCSYVIGVMNDAKASIETVHPAYMTVTIKDNDMNHVNFYAIPSQPMGKITAEKTSNKNIEEIASSQVKICDTTKTHECYVTHSFFEESSLFYLPGSQMFKLSGKGLRISYMNESFPTQVYNLLNDPKAVQTFEF